MKNKTENHGILIGTALEIRYFTQIVILLIIYRR